MVRRRMRAIAWGIASMWVGSWACSFDERPITLQTALNPALGGVDGSGDPAALDAGGVGAQSSGPAAPKLRVEPLSLDLGPAIIGAASRGRVALLNVGDAPLSIPTVELLAGSEPSFTILHNQCDESIAPGERCDVRIQLVASKSGVTTATLAVQSSGGNAEVPLAASGVAGGILLLAPTAGGSGDFGSVVLGSSAEESFDVSNPDVAASGPLAISVNDDQFRLLEPAEGDCRPGSTTLVNGQSCRIRLAFVPRRRGATDASLVIVSQGAGGAGLALSGVGRLPPELAVAPGTVDFGDVVLTGVAQRTLFVENKGDQPLELAGTTLADGASSSPTVESPPPEADAQSAFSVLNSDCGAGKQLIGGERCSVRLAFRPLTAQASQQSLLLVGAADGTQRSVPLLGNGLEQGSLVLAPAPGGSADFGELLVNTSQTRTFVATNQSAQPSGPLDIHSSDDFVLISPSADGDCRSGVTSLVNGESCAIGVMLTPSDRGPRDGSLNVASALAGAAQLGLVGRGLSAANVAVAQREIDFGRVPTETEARRTLTVSNTGEQALPAPRATLSVPDGSSPEGFSLENGCTSELAPNATCEVGVVFLPVVAAPHTAILKLASDLGGSASTLLLGEAFARGSLVLAGTGGSSDFGDVVIGAPRTLDFTLTNPNSVPSGRLIITTNDILFSVDEGDCNPAGGSGLVDGQSCTFSVTFVPVTSEQVSVNLSVQSSGVGETSLALIGHGRSPASLAAATGNRDFASANVAQDALREPSNQFTWVLTNEGDLATGPLQIQNDNVPEFVVSNDTCSNASVAGHGTCQIDIRFRPSAAGSRTGALAVTDAASSQVRRLVMTGNGVRIAAPGQNCVNAECSTGTCTGGVCCDRDCKGSCQVCSTTGVCSDESARQTCGNGSGQCFGVDRCLLPERQPCSGDEQCGDGHCEPRLGGQNTADQICCLDACANGQLCSPQTGRCQAPTSGQGVACGAAGQLPCAAGLSCKACLNGGNACTPTADCCGGCLGEQVCAPATGTCGCPVQTNGRTQIDCGGGRCIQDRANACCNTRSGCTGQDQCNPANDLCECPAGTRECVANSNVCVANAQCCNCDGVCQACNNGTCSVVAAGQPGRCGAGQFCNDRGLCVAPNPAALTTLAGGAPAPFDRTLVGVPAATPRLWSVQNTGGSPTGALQYNGTNDLEFQVAGNCIGLILQPQASCSVSITFTPRGPGTRRSTLRLASGQTVAVTVDVQGIAKIRDGSPCSATIADCDSNRCTEWLIDADGDGFGARQAIGGFPSARACGDASAANRPPPLFMAGKGCQGTDLTLPYVAPQAFDDCCDGLNCQRGSLAAGSFTSAAAFPGQTQPQGGTAICNGNSTRTSDFDCIGGAVVRDVVHPACGAVPVPSTEADCEARSGFQLGPLVCGTAGFKVPCRLLNGVCGAVGGLSVGAFPLCL